MAVAYIGYPEDPVIRKRLADLFALTTNSQTFMKSAMRGQAALGKIRRKPRKKPTTTRTMNMNAQLTANHL